MKKLLLSVFALTIFSGLSAQCADLFISEYVEGSSNNKALEIYNPTPNAIALDNKYRLVRYNNGTTAAAGEANAQASINLGTHVIPSGGTWVIVLDKRDASQPCPGMDCAVDLALQAKADTFLCPDYAVSFAMYFNGNDALSLQKFNGSSWNYVDIFGMMGDPAMVSGVAWSDEFPYDGSAGTWWTIDHTLIRKPTVTGGVTTNPSPEFIVTTEWDSLSENTYSQLRMHTSSCPVSVDEIGNEVNVSVYPNPSSSGIVNVSATEAILSATVYNALGQEVLVRNGSKNERTMKIVTDELPEGVYFLKATFDENRTTLVRISVQ